MHDKGIRTTGCSCIFKARKRPLKNGEPSVRLRKMKARIDILNLSDIPNVGPATTRYLSLLGINTPFELVGQDPIALYTELCRITGKTFDPCLADVFISAVRFVEGEPAREWWHFSKKRKAILSDRKEET